ncbi:MAG: hypothetical protein AAFX06_33640 [Planctomycetota bacterium]
MSDLMGLVFCIWCSAFCIPEDVGSVYEQMRLLRDAGAECERLPSTILAGYPMSDHLKVSIRKEFTGSLGLLAASNVWEVELHCDREELVRLIGAVHHDVFTLRLHPKESSKLPPALLSRFTRLSEVSFARVESPDELLAGCTKSRATLNRLEIDEVELDSLQLRTIAEAAPQVTSMTMRDCEFNGLSVRDLLPFKRLERLSVANADFSAKDILMIENRTKFRAMKIKSGVLLFERTVNDVGEWKRGAAGL